MARKINAYHLSAEVTVSLKFHDENPREEADKIMSRSYRGDYKKVSSNIETVPGGLDRAEYTFRISESIPSTSKSEAKERLEEMFLGEKPDLIYDSIQVEDVEPGVDVI